jgi:monovalent cation/hydrogen antiporter
VNDPSAVLLIAFAMVALTALTSLAARRMHVPQSIFLVLVGAALAYAPRFPVVKLNPDLVLLALLPPLLYSSGVGMSWRGFKENLRPIMLLAVGCVLFTASAVAAATHWLLHLPWGVGFVLGAVVSPPDAVAPMAIARRLSVPKKILTVLEGEGLVNDATALILFSFAIGAVITGSVSILDAAATFGIIVVSEIVWGFAVGWGLLHLRAWAKNTEVEMILALLTPFAAFWPPHFLGGSGVLAAVTAGLYTSWNGPGLISPATRLQGFFVWGLVVYIIEGIVFFLTGLQSRVVMEGPDAGEWSRMIWAAAMTVVVVIVIRFVWVFPATYLPPLLFGGRPAAPAAPAWQETFLVSFTGIRGVVSLIAALSVPEMVGSQQFPERDLILFVTFCVILVSLVGQGAALPKVIEFLGLDKAGTREARSAKRDEVTARVAAIQAALEKLKELETQGADRRAVANVRRLHEDRRMDFIQTADEAFDGAPVVDAASIQLNLVAAERASIARQFAEGKLTDEARRRVERELDLDDARVRHAVDSATGQGFDRQIEPDNIMVKTM